MRAGRFDILVETGAAYVRAAKLMRPDTGIPASTVTPGDYVYVDGWPRPVYSVTAPSNGRVTIAFDKGLWSDLSLTVDGNALVQPAVPMFITDAQAAFHVAADPPVDMPIPVIVAPDRLSCEIDMDPIFTAALSPNVGAHSWDMFAQTAEWDWQRVLEGTFVIVEGDAR
jgi:hypothetical protein